MKQNYTFKWEGTGWWFEPNGASHIKKQLIDLATYLRLKQHLMSRYEVRLYNWILKKQYKADPIEIVEWIEEMDFATNTGYRLVGKREYYLGYYNPARKYPVHQEDEYAKEQQKLRSRFHSKMGR